MKQNIKRTLRAWWAVATSLGLGCAAMLLPTDSLSKATEEIVTYVSIIAAGATTAMALSATVLRGSAISVRRVQKFSAALEQQFGLWFTLVAACVVSAFFTVIAQIFNWQLSIETPTPIELSINIIYGIIFVIAFSTSFSFFKIGEFLLGLRRLLRINNEIALEEAKSTAKAELEKSRAASPPLPERPNFGQFIENTENDGTK